MPLTVESRWLVALAGVVVCFMAGAAAAMHPALVAPVALAAALVYLTQLVHGGPILTTFAVLLAGTIAIGKPFAEIKAGPVYITELGLAVVGLAVGVRWCLAPPRDKLMPDSVRLALGAYLVCGAIAVIVGARAQPDRYYVERDAVLAVYAATVVLIVLTLRDRTSLERMLRALYWAGGAATFVGLAAVLGIGAINTPRVAIAQGMAFFFVPVLARWTRGGRVARWEGAIVATQFALIAVLASRTTLIGIAAVLVILGATSASTYGRWRLVALGALTLILSLAVVVISPSAQQSASGLVPGQGNSGSQNGSWRIDFWKQDLRAVAHKPLTGVGFGPGANFCFRLNDYCDDNRTTRDDPHAITGPHNSFVDVAFRMGIPGFAALILLLSIAVRRAWRSIPSTGDLGRVSVALFAYAALIAFFNVSLEGPYLGVPFWATVGMLVVCGGIAGSRSVRAEGSAVPETAPL